MVILIFASNIGVVKDKRQSNVHLSWNFKEFEPELGLDIFHNFAIGVEFALE